MCAPTGAGKTNIAMLAVLREISLHRRGPGGAIDRSAFKIVYVAPMKALASEVTANFGKRLKPLGLVVRELTGDMQLTKAELQATQMIVTTPEKWDVVTRKGGDAAVASLVRLLIIDEVCGGVCARVGVCVVVACVCVRVLGLVVVSFWGACLFALRARPASTCTRAPSTTTATTKKNTIKVHLLNDERGPVIETLVARTLRQVEASQAMIRITGLSATLPNYRDVATFLRVNHDTGVGWV